MFFVLIAVVEELCEQSVGGRQGGDLLGGEDGGEAFLPVIMEAFDLPLSLRSRSKAQGDIVEAQGGPELSEGFGSVGKKERVVIDVESQRYSAGPESTGKKVEMGEQGLSRVNLRVRNNPAMIVDDLKQMSGLMK